MAIITIEPPKKKEYMEITDDHVQRFSGFIQEGIVAWVKAGKLLVQMVEKNPNTYAIIRKAHPEISIDVLLAFERIGRGEIYPYLLIDKSVGAQRLLGYPYEQQNKYYHEPVAVVTMIDAQGKPVIRNMTVQNMSKEHVKRVFGEKGPRSIQEQVSLFDIVPVSRNKISQIKDKPAENRFQTIGYYMAEVDKEGKVTFKSVPKPFGTVWSCIEVTKQANGTMRSTPFTVESSKIK